MNIGSKWPEKILTIAMAWWWTWGHVFPIKSLLEWIQKKPQYTQRIKNIYWFGSENGLEYQVYKPLSMDMPQLHFVPILSGKYRRETIWISRYKNIRDIFLFIAGFFQSLFRLIRYRVDVVFCKWWYVALPVVFAAALLQRKVIVHESDTHPWLVNRLASRFAKKVFTGFDNALPNAKTVGQIISDEILIEEAEPRSRDKPKILIVWGSQGSKRLYQTIFRILEKNPELQTAFDFFIVLGLLNEELASQANSLPSIRVYTFLSQTEMGHLYNDCDIAITRGGTTSLAEQKLYDMKQIIIPIPRTHDQYDNARRYVHHYKDMMIDQRDVGFEVKLTKALFKLRTFKKKESKKDRQAVISKAKEIIVRSILNLE